MRMQALLSALTALALPARAATLELDSFLNQVKEANRAVQVSGATIEASELRYDSTDIIFSPQVFSQVGHTVDRKEPTSALAPERTEATQLSFGIQRLWQNGLQSQVAFNMTQVNLDHQALPGSLIVPISIPNPLNPAAPINQLVPVPLPLNSLLPPERYTDSRVQIDLVHPLLKNAEGRDAALLRENSQGRIKLQQLTERFKMKNLYAQAEAVYWQLALAQEAVRSQEASIERFKKIRSWASNRAQSQLGDRADFLQADSGLRLKVYELETLKKDQRILQRAFNTLRGREGDTVESQLASLSSARIINQAEASAQDVKRLDIEIARQAERVAQIEVEQSREKYRPQLDLFGSVASNSLENNAEDSIPRIFKLEHPTYVVGAKFSMPLDGGLIEKDRQGLIRASQAAGLEAEQRSFNAAQEYADLQSQLKDAGLRLRLAEELETAQKEKLGYERTRLDRGRTTTYQVLLFEQDFASAQLNTIRTKAEILGLRAKLKLFGDET